MKKTFYSNGKLLITGEYLVLDGAKAFALPTKFGQDLIVEAGINKEIKWTSYDADGIVWFEETIPFSEISSLSNTQKESIKNTLITILHEAYLLNPDFITNSEGYHITTNLTFPRKWGLGTSSTLINNIGQWLEIDAFTLLNNSFGGSGYDIACAQNDGPILYHLDKGKPVVEKVTFDPEFANNIYFVYLNKKQSSKSSIENYQMNKMRNLDKRIRKFDEITKTILYAKTEKAFAQAIALHESEMSVVLETETVKESLFSDFEGEMKSLGAWGGDFILVIAESNPSDYFTTKGYNTVLTYDEMILK